MFRFTLVSSILVLILVGVSHGHGGATGIVKERMDAMQDMADISKVVADMFKGKSEFSRDALMDAARAFSSHGASMVDLFPDTKASRTGSSTEALSTIWDDWESFERSAAEFVLLSDALMVDIDSGVDKTALKKAFFKTTKGCSGCHKQFRKPKR